MAILTYGLVLASLATLVAGFFINTSSLPLLVSIGLSAAAVGLIVFGWARRLREQRELDFAALDDESVVVELGDETTELPGLEPDLEPQPDLEVVEELEPEPGPSAKPAPKVKPKAKAKAKPKAKAKAKPKAKPKPGSSSRKRVVVLPGRNRYHDPSCRFADHPDAERVTEGAAVKREAEPCSVCLPDRLSDDGGTRRSPGSTPDRGTGSRPGGRSRGGGPEPRTRRS